MGNDISLSASVRDNLLALKTTENLIARTQGRLSTGLKVASVIDDARAFFEAKALNDLGTDLDERREGIDQGISSVTTALEATEAIDDLVGQLKGVAISAKTATGTELTILTNQFNEILNQIDNLASDAQYQGLNLINGTGQTLEVFFSTDTTSLLSIASVDLRTASTGLNISSGANFSVLSNIDTALAEIDVGISTLRGRAEALGANVALLQTRLQFTDRYVNVLEEGADKLTLADITEEGANLVALQTRQQLGISALAFAGQAEQSVLSLFN